MAANKSSAGKQYYTPAKANASLPLVRAIVQDIVDLATEIRDRYERIARFRPGNTSGLSPAHEEELIQDRQEFDRCKDRMRQLECELEELGVELKDYFTGLIDFRCRMDGRDVYLCWRLGEPEVAHWHELNSGFAGRQKLKMDTSRV